MKKKTFGKIIELNKYDTNIRPKLKHMSLEERNMHIAIAYTYTTHTHAYCDHHRFYYCFCSKTHTHINDIIFEKEKNYHSPIDTQKFNIPLFTYV